MNPTQQYDLSQIPDPPPEYPATVAYVRRKVSSGVGEAQSAAAEARSAAESAKATAEAVEAKIPSLEEGISAAQATADAAKAQADADAADISQAKSDAAFAKSQVEANRAEVANASSDAASAKSQAASAQAAASEAGDLAYKANEYARTAISTANAAKSAAEEAKSSAEAAQASAEELASGLPAKADLVGGKVPVSQLPSYVSDVYEYDSVSAFPASGDSGKIYVARDTNLTYRWGGTAYVEISPSLALGETAETAYAGSKGAALRDDLDEVAADYREHRRRTDNPHSVTAAQVGAYTKEEVGLKFADVDVQFSLYAEKTDLPTKVSQLANDLGYVNESLVPKTVTDLQDGKDYPTNEDVDEKLAPYAKTADLPTVPTKVSAFENDAEYVTESQADTKLAPYAKTADLPTVPTKVSALENDAKYITESQVTLPYDDTSSGSVMYAYEARRAFAVAWGKVEDTPTTLDGYGITDAVKRSEAVSGGDFTALSTTVDSHTNRIAQLESAVAAKADKSAFDALEEWSNNEFATRDNVLAVLEGRADSLESKVDAANASLESVA